MLKNPKTATGAMNNKAEHYTVNLYGKVKSPAGLSVILNVSVT